ncbi:glutamate synthase-related protein [Tepidibacillus marianensis]|uniref:glutamate synthase-related protein n=1 Tax=Tepidibacillus marianensis TaxID=3131995 RepID=UPI0030CAC908
MIKQKYYHHHFSDLLFEEHDSCGIIAVIEKKGIPTQQNLSKTIDALVKMEHRSGFINGEGDGSGVLTDIPRKLWAARLKKAGQPPELATNSRFVVGHIFIDSKVNSVTNVQEVIRQKFANYQFEILLEEEGQVHTQHLGPNGKAIEPLFWQIAAISQSPNDIRTLLFQLMTEIEQEKRAHVASLSNYSVVYKVMGAANVLKEYFVDLLSPLFESVMTIGHNRYSTNTLSHFFRVQPFSLLGHNGEINTIQRLRDEATMLDIPLVYGGSDSQDLNRIIEGLMTKYDFSLFEVMEIIFPPIYNEIRRVHPQLQNLYTFMRHIWGPFAQGPAGIVSRFENQAIFSVDALGLRPLWKVETSDTLYFSSEQGIILTQDMVSEPNPLAPGEKFGVILKQDLPIQVVPHHELQQINLNRLAKRFPLSNYRNKLEPPHFIDHVYYIPQLPEIPNHVYLQFGWEKEHIDLAGQMASSGKEPIRSLGYDGSLAVLSKDRVNLSDFLKETVAVVTNPAIDREREIEHFSTRMILGGREDFTPHQVGDISFEIRTPILLEGKHAQNIVEELGTTSLEKTIHYFSNMSPNYLATLSLSFNKNQSIKERLAELNQEAIQAVVNGAKILFLDDEILYTSQNYLWLDPHLALSSIDIALREYLDQGESIRRKVGIILRSGSIRHLHDLVTAIGLGADAVSPYLLFATITSKGNQAIKNLYEGLNKGLEKVISTLGIHELRGYERLFSSIGLHEEIAEIFNIINFYGGRDSGYSLKDLEESARHRHQDYHSSVERLSNGYRVTPKLWKSIQQVANGSLSYSEYSNKLTKLEQENPIALRHLLDLPSNPPIVPLEKVKIGIGDHDYPFVISSMSFGSQSETAFRAYAEAAYQLNMMSLNGEGGEIKDMLGKYPKHRGMQIASGRFGVNIELINSSHWIEIKIGQGAKPGEGGHLPGSKVSEKVAAARNATPGNDLISPSNNHDIYSIEDLAQIVSELKIANRFAKVIIKVPVVPNIGTIAVGIAKAGADVISLSGYDGGTGAARAHAIQHVGLPVEIGVKATHTSLIEAGLRDTVEVWADGGVKSGIDVVKLILLGANRVGFGTLAMMAIGCTACRGCHLDTCHVGIATQIQSITEARNRGLKQFVPRQYELAIEQLTRLFQSIGQEVKETVSRLGSTNLQELVGRSDLLNQTRLNGQVNLEPLLKLIEREKQEVTIINQESKRSVAVGAEELTSAITSNHYDIDLSSQWINSTHRMVGSRVSGDRVRPHMDGGYRSLPPLKLRFKHGSVAGNGLAAYLAGGIDIRIHGGGQDGVAKTAYGGKVTLLKTENKYGLYINGSVGKSCCYGAQKGLFIIQGNADSRAGIRLSGADVIIGGEITSPIQDHLGAIGERANIKGFAFEYMTNGRAVVLGDPGPWICSGMTGGVIYQRLVPEFGFDQKAIERRIAKGSSVLIFPLDQKGKMDLTELLNAYIIQLTKSGQDQSVQKIRTLLNDLDRHFVRIISKSDSEILTVETTE